jgi:nitrogen fixation NifU-like protein
MSYSAVFKQHLAHPQNVGELAEATAVAEETNPVCGDRMRLYLQINDGTIETARYLAYGCPPTLVCGSVLTEMAEGKTTEEALAISKHDLLNAVGGLPSRKHHSAALAIEVLQAALNSSNTTQV